MKKYTIVGILIFILTIGYATVGTILDLKGDISVGFNENDIELYFSKAMIDGKKKNSIIKDDVRIEKTFSITKDITSIMVDYDVTNGSYQYDMAVNVYCKILGNETSVDLINTFDTGELLLATETRSGKVEIKPITYQTGSSYTVTLTCKISSSLIERDTISDGTPNEKVPLIQEPSEVMKGKYKGESSLINFNTPADDSETGIYSIKGENDKDVYFYRGNVIDNNIIFADFCWKILRTTETGGTKIIYNGVPSADGKCNNTGDASQIGTSVWNSSYNDNAYVGYMYGATRSDTYEATHENKNPSTIKTYIDDWYEKNIQNTEYENLLEDVVWCNDRSTASGTDNNTANSSQNDIYGTLGYTQNMTGYGSLARASTWTKIVTPSLICPQDNDKFTVGDEIGNGKLTYPIGLITLDEYALAGYTSTKTVEGTYKSDYAVPTTNYLYTGNSYWSFSPSIMGKSAAVVGNVSKYLDCRNVDYKIGVRPAIALSSEAIITSGDGTVDNPFIVE